MENKSEIIRDTIKHCLYRQEEITDNKPPEGFIEGDAIVKKYAFHPGRLDEKKEIIKELLSDMQDPFFMDKGGGWTFLNMPFDRHDQQWGEQPTAGDLCALGIASGMLKFLLPRDMWSSLPGSVPYVGINLDGFKEDKCGTK